MLGFRVGFTLVVVIVSVVAGVKAEETEVLFDCCFDLNLFYGFLERLVLQWSSPSSHN